MSVATVAGLLTAIPWKTIIEHGPGLLDSARGLFKKSRDPNVRETPEERLERLEKIVKEQAQLIEQLAERQNLLLTAIQVINSRLKALIACTVLSFAGLAACITLLLLR